VAFPRWFIYGWGGLTFGALLVGAALHQDPVTALAQGLLAGMGFLAGAYSATGRRRAAARVIVAILAVSLVAPLLRAYVYPNRLPAVVVELRNGSRTPELAPGYHAFVVRALASGVSGRPALHSWQVIDVDLTVEIVSFNQKITTFTVRSSGAAEITTTFTVLIEFDPPAEQRTIDVLRIGAGSSESFRVPTPTALDCSNGCDVQVTVDSGGTVPELSEDNNVASESIVG